MGKRGDDRCGTGRDRAIRGGARRVVRLDPAHDPAPGDRPPLDRRGGRADLYRCGENDWVDSFWCGQLWLVWDETNDEAFFAAARAQCPYFAARLDRPASHDHDLGFLYCLSTLADYRLTGDATGRDLSLRAADALAGRFNRAGNFIQAWNAPAGASPEEARRRRGKIIIDCMMNLGLLFWAARGSGRDELAAIAVAHADTNTRYIIRPDGSTYHTYDFDPDTGAPLGGFTAQGFADESCWSRGHAWAIHGYTQTYRHTGAARFLATARHLADWALAHLPADGVPLWDYRLTADAPPYRDSSAAAIEAAGLLLLAQTLGDDPAAARYRASAERILIALIEGYTTFAGPEAEGLLLHGASHVARGRSDTMLPYGDYFFVEALLRARGRERFFW
jgi:unsaturated chondroitin disaccharide hydrolase